MSMDEPINLEYSDPQNPNLFYLRSYDCEGNNVYFSKQTYTFNTKNVKKIKAEVPDVQMLFDWLNGTLLSQDELAKDKFLQNDNFENWVKHCKEEKKMKGFRYIGKTYFLYKNNLWERLDDQEVLKIIFKYVKKSNHLMRPMTSKVAKEIECDLRTLSSESEEKFFIQSYHKINFVNGIYHLDTNKFTEHDSKYKLTHKLDYTFNEVDTEHPVFDNAIFPLFNNGQEFELFLAIVGTIPFRLPLRKAIFLVGEGKNGKSTLLEIIQMLFSGHASTSVPLQNLAESLNLAPMEFAFTNISTENSPVGLKSYKTEGIFKSLTSHETVDARIMYKGIRTIKPRLLQFYAMNDTPLTNTKSDSLYDRMIIFKFNKKIKRTDPNILKKIKPELSQILSHCIKLAREKFKISFKNNHFIFDSNYLNQFKNQALQEVIEDDKTDVSRWLEFLCANGKIKFDAMQNTRTKEMVKHFKEWALLEGLNPSITAKKMIRDARSFFVTQYPNEKIIWNHTIRDQGTIFRSNIGISLTSINSTNYNDYSII